MTSTRIQPGAFRCSNEYGDHQESAQEDMLRCPLLQDTSSLSRVGEFRCGLCSTHGSEALTLRSQSSRCSCKESHGTSDLSLPLTLSWKQYSVHISARARCSQALKKRAEWLETLEMYGPGRIRPVSNSSSTSSRERLEYSESLLASIPPYGFDQHSYEVSPRHAENQMPANVHEPP